MPLPPGTLLQDRYELVRLLGQGGFGAVYEAIDRRLANSRCAIKQLTAPPDGDDPDYAPRKFQEEMEALSRLRHPGIPRVQDYFENFIVLDYIAGRTFEQLDDVTPRRAVELIRGALDPIGYLHAQTPPLVHRDIKPANLMVEDGTGQVKLLDFGLSRQHKETMSPVSLVATLGYAPLEQLQGELAPQNDLFAVGMTLRFLLTGKAPATITPQPLAEGHSALAAIVNKACHPKPEQRYASAEEMSQALACWDLQPVERPDNVAVPTQVLPVPSRRRPLLLGGGAVALAAAAALALLGPLRLPAGFHRVDGPAPTTLHLPFKAPAFNETSHFLALSQQPPGAIYFSADQRVGIRDAAALQDLLTKAFTLEGWVVEPHDPLPPPPGLPPSGGLVEAGIHTPSSTQVGIYRFVLFGNSVAGWVFQTDAAHSALLSDWFVHVPNEKTMLELGAAGKL